MFRYEYPIFEHKNLLKKNMLDELRDYPLNLSRMYFSEYGDGIMQGCGLSWENEVLRLNPGLIHYGGNIYRMENPYSLACPATGQLTYLKVHFATIDYERGRQGGVGEILLSDEPPESGEMELGRFQLQEGARLRTVYENFEDYQTEYDTVNRIYVPYMQVDGVGLWPQLLKVYAVELLETGTTDVNDVSFAMALLGAGGHVSHECIAWYVHRAGGHDLKKTSNAEYYRGLLDVLKNRVNGGTGWKHQDGSRRQMILL